MLKNEVHVHDSNGGLLAQKSHLETRFEVHKDSRSCIRHFCQF